MQGLGADGFVFLSGRRGLSVPHQTPPPESPMVTYNRAEQRESSQRNTHAEVIKSGYVRAGLKGVRGDRGRQMNFSVVIRPSGFRGGRGGQDMRNVKMLQEEEEEVVVGGI